MNQAFFVWVVLCLIWGSTWIFIKLGLRDLPPMLFAGWRFTVAAVVLWGIVAWRRRPMPRAARDWRMLALTGVLAFSVNYALVFWSEQYISSGLAAVLQATIPAFGMIFAHFHLPHERLTWRKALGVLLGIGGVGLIFYDQVEMEGRMALLGCAAMIVSALVVSYYNVLIKARAGHIDPAVLAAGQMTFGLVPLMSIGLFFERAPVWTPRAIGSLLYLALVGSAIAFLLYYWLVMKIEVTRTMLISLVTPVIALLLGWFIAAEPLSWRVAAGSLAILSGIGLVIAIRR